MQSAGAISANLMKILLLLCVCYKLKLLLIISILLFSHGATLLSHLFVPHEIMSLDQRYMTKMLVRVCVCVRCFFLSFSTMSFKYDDYTLVTLCAVACHTHNPALSLLLHSLECMESNFTASDFLNLYKCS